MKEVLLWSLFSSGWIGLVASRSKVKSAKSQGSFFQRPFRHLIKIVIGERILPSLFGGGIQHQQWPPNRCQRFKNRTALTMQQQTQLTSIPTTFNFCCLQFNTTSARRMANAEWRGSYAESKVFAAVWPEVAVCMDAFVDLGCFLISNALKIHKSKR